MDHLLLTADQSTRAFQLMLKIYRHQPQLNNEDESQNTSEHMTGNSERQDKQPLNYVIEKQNKEHTRKTEEFAAKFRNLERRKSELQKEPKVYKSRFPILTKPTTPSEQFSKQVECRTRSRNNSSLSEKSASLRSFSRSQSAVNVNDIVNSVQNSFPASVARVNRLRQEFEHNELMKTRPYRGEWGPQSYKGWQMSDYFMVRPIVEELVDRVLGIVVKSRSLHTLDAFPRSRSFGHIPSNSKLIQLILEEIILEETQKLSRTVCAQTFEMQRFLVEQTKSHFVRTFQEATCNNCEITRAEYDGLFKTLPEKFLNLQENRIRDSQEIWGQSLLSRLDPWKQKNDDNVSSVDHVINFDHLMPFDLIKASSSAHRSETERSWSRSMDTYRQREAEYWSSMVSNSLTLPSTVNCSGISVVRASFNRRYSAVGTVLGIVFVIAFDCNPPKPIRLGVGVKGDRVVDIAWSLDSLRLVSVTANGVLCVWSLANEKNAVVSTEESNDGKSPMNFLPVFRLDAAVQDFKFYTGPLAERSQHNNPTKPLLAAFHSSMTLCGSQPSICVGLDSHDVIRCDISEQFDSNEETENNYEPNCNDPSFIVYHPQVLPHNERGNKIGSDVRAEVFRHHNHPITVLGFVGNCRDMVTVDTVGYINRWKYTREFLTKEETFRPCKRYRLSLIETQYEPSGEPQVIFSDSGDDKSRPEAEIEQERNRAESLLSSSLRQLDLWYSQSVENRQRPMDTFFYRPSEGVSSSGTFFHIIDRNSKTKRLSSWHTQFFFPVQNEATRILLCRLSPSGKEIVFVLIFPQLNPKDAHLTVLVLDLCEMRLKNFRQDVFLSNELYQRCLDEPIVSCDISDPVGISSSQYVFLLINGQLSGYSVATGQKVLTTAAKKSPGFAGCQLNPKKLSITEGSRLSVNSAPGVIFLNIFEPEQKNSENPLFILRLNDKSTELTRKLLQNSIIHLHGDTTLPLSAQRMDLVRYTTGPLGSQHHIQVMARDLIESIVDRIFDQKNGITSPPSDSNEDHERRARIYAALSHNIENVPKDRSNASMTRHKLVSGI